MDISSRCMGDLGSCFRSLLFLASLPVLPSHIYIVYRHHARYGDSTYCELVVSARSSQDSGSYTRVSHPAAPARRVPVVVVSTDLRAKFNTGKRCTELLPKPAQ